jgi:heptosyltransferase-3
MPIFQPAPASILFIAVSRIGDTLFATPAIRAVAAAYPQARIEVLGHPARADVFRHLPFVHWVGAITKHRARWGGWLGGVKFDLAFVYGHDRPLLDYALRVAEKVVAFRQGDEAVDSRLYVAVSQPAFQSEHAVRQTLRLPNALGIPAAGLRIAYRASDEEIAAAQRRLAAAAPGAHPLIGLQIASFPTKSYRDWPVEHFAALARTIRNRWGNAHFLIFGGKAELPRVRQLAADLGDCSTVLAGRISLRETAAVMTQLDLYVGVDTGPTHIMSAFDIPLVALYHCISSSKHTGPLEHPCAYVIDHPASRERCTEMSGMADIHVDTVFAEVERAMTEHPPSQR